MIGGRPADESVSPVIPIRDAASRRRTACRVWDWAVERPVLSVVCVAAVIRIAVAIALNVLDNWSFALDSGQYLAIAEAKADGRLEEFWIGYGSSLYSTTRTFSGQLSFLFWLFGPYRFLGQLLSVVYGAAAAGLTTSVALRLVRRPLALVSGLAVALAPSQVVFSSTAIRESLVWFLLVAAAVICSRLGPRVGRPSIVIGVAGLAVIFYLLASLRVQTAIIALWCMTLALVVVRGRRLLRTGGAALLFMVVPLLVGHSPGGISFLLNSAGQLGSIRTYMAMSADSAITKPELLTVQADAVQASTAGSNYSGPSIPSSILDREEHPGLDGQKFVIDMEGRAAFVHNDLPASFRALPHGLLAVTLRPTPWEPPSENSTAVPVTRRFGRRQLAGLESIMWLPLFVLAGVGAWVRRGDAHVVALPASLIISLTFAAAVTQGNLGTAFRHRGQICFALSILAVAGLQAVIDRRRRGDRKA